MTHPKDFFHLTTPPLTCLTSRGPSSFSVSKTIKFSFFCLKSHHQFTKSARGRGLLTWEGNGDLGRWSGSIPFDGTRFPDKIGENSFVFNGQHFTIFPFLFLEKKQFSLSGLLSSYKKKESLLVFVRFGVRFRLVVSLCFISTSSCSSSLILPSRRKVFLLSLVISCWSLDFSFRRVLEWYSISRSRAEKIVRRKF